MAMRRINLTDESYQSFVPNATTKRLLNFYPEPLPTDSISPFVLRSTPGLLLSTTVGAGPVYAINGDLNRFVYLVSGSSFYRVSFPTLPGGPPIPTLLGSVGTVAPLYGYPSIAVGVISAVVCVPPNAYVVDHSGTTLHQITDPNFGGASSVAYIDGFFVFTAFANEGSFFCSNLLNAGNFNALNFAYDDSRPNFLQRVIEHNGLLWFAGESGWDAWYNAGTANFPFARQAGSEVPYGCASKQTAVVCDNAIFFLGMDGRIYRIDTNAQATRVSTFAMEDWIRLNTDTTHVDACSFVFEGHECYAISFFENNAQKTYVYDCIVQKWHERSTSAAGNTTWAVMSAALLGNTAIFGDRSSGNLYNLAEGTGLDNGSQVARIIISPPIVANGRNRAFMSRLELVVQPAVATMESRIQLDISDDGGVTWRSWGNSVTMGASGDTMHRAVWNRLGSFRQRSLRFTFYDKANVYSLDADIEEGVV